MVPATHLAPILVDLAPPLLLGGRFPVAMLAPILVGGAQSTPADLPPTFPAAILELLESSGDLASRVTGGFWNRIAPPGMYYPLCIFVISNAPNERIGGANYLQSGTLSVATYSPDAQEAREIADEVVTAVVSDAGYAMAWDGGHVNYLSLASPASPAPPRPGYAGSQVQAEVRAFEYQIQGYFPR